MIFVCHPEATCFSSPPDLGAPHDSSAHFADKRNVRQVRSLIRYIHYDSNEGGKSSAKFGQTRMVRAVCLAFGSVSHRLLVISS
jgi:hypothetical protein